MFIDGPETILIANVMIYDGTGDIPFKGQVRIKGDRILSVERGMVPQIGSDGQIIDGMGLELAPGFIDTHSHHDIGLDKEPEASAVITQGVTTIVRGMDGFSEGFQDPNYFIGIIPDFIPLKELVCYLTGLMEIVGGVMLLIPKYRKNGAYLLILLLIIVFPSNIYLYI